MRFTWAAGLCALALLAGAFCTAALAAGADALHLPTSWEGNLPGADGTVHWHLDLLPEQHYRLRRTYEGKPAPNRFDEIGRWARAADGSRLELYVAGEKRAQFLVEADGSLRKLDTAGKPIATGVSDRLERLPQPELIEPRLKISGLFIYMADAAVITLCADGSRLPVAMEGDFRALQAAYMKARPPHGGALLATVEGRIATRPSMEESLPPLDTLVVERFISLSPQGSCGRAAPVSGTVKAQHAPATAYCRDRTAKIEIKSSPGRVSAFNHRPEVLHARASWAYDSWASKKSWGAFALLYRE